MWGGKILPELFSQLRNIAMDFPVLFSIAIFRREHNAAYKTRKNNMKAEDGSLP